MLGVLILVSLVVMCCWCCGCFNILFNLFANKPHVKENNQFPSNNLKLNNLQKEKFIPTCNIPISCMPSLSEYSYDKPFASSSADTYRDKISEPETPKVDVRPKQKKVILKVGKFNCKNCVRYWSSVHSSKDYFQKCIICKREVYPYRLLSILKKAGAKIPSKPHLKELCEICINQGDCRRLKNNLINKNR